MTDQRSTDELESRLRDGFRRAELPVAPDTLRAALERVPDASVGAGRAHGDGARRSGSRSGWGVIGLAAALAVSGALALAVGQRSPIPGPEPVPSSPGPLALDPSPAAGVRITYEAVWTVEQPANAADLQAIGTILRKRLDATGVTYYALNSGGDSRFTVDLASGADADAIRSLLGVTGHVIAVPVGDVVPEVGSVIEPERSARVFDSTGIASASVRMGQPETLVLRIELQPAAARDFGKWTASNVGSFMAIAIDGIVATVPQILSGIPDGQIEISIADGPPGLVADTANRMAAIIEAGPLPVPIREVAAEPLPGGSPPVPVATSPAGESPSPAAFALTPIRSDLGCDTIPAPYESFVFHIDLTATETVWAVADTGVRLRTEWGSSFRGLIGPPATVVDGGGLSLADGTIVRTPNGDWPVLGGHFVCPSAEMISVFDQAPG